MACQPSSTFLLVASSTSKAGTICPAGMASILIPPWVSLSTRSLNILKCSCSVLLAGQVDCILIDFGACACAASEKAARTAAAATRRFIECSSQVGAAKLRPRLRTVNAPSAAQGVEGRAEDALGHVDDEEHQHH